MDSTRFQATVIRGTTRIVGIFGDPVTHTLSPAMHNAAFARLNLDFAYLPFWVRPEDLGAAVKSIRALNLAGVNVTIPHKESILPFLDAVTPHARRIGAVNTVVQRGGRLTGHNTDAPGFLSSLKEDGKFDPRNKSAMILGAGGTARAIAAALLEARVRKLTVLNRTLKRAQSLAKSLKTLVRGATFRAAALSRRALRDELRDCDLLVNATPGGAEVLGPSLDAFLSHRIFVFDVVYSRTTPLLAGARRRGASCLNGLGMLARQGALSFSLWTGAKPPLALMEKVLRERSGGRP